ATAQVARFGAIIEANYPQLWPETVRGLVVQSARWTRPMQTALDSAISKRRRFRLLRRYGFGVPNLERALRSAADALTLIVQGSIHPFASGRMQEAHFHELPWPSDALN